MKMRIASAVAALVVAAGLIIAGPVLADPPEPNGVKDLVSGVLEGRRLSSFTCDIVNKTDAPLDGITIKLKKPDGTQFGPTKWCDGVAPNAACELNVLIAFPELDVATYCHATVPKVFVVGSHRLEGPAYPGSGTSETIAESLMEADIHGKLALISEQLDNLGSVTIRAAQNCTFDNGQGAQTIAANGTFELNVDCPDDEFAAGCGCEVFDAGGNDAGFATHKDSVSDTLDPVPSRCRCQWTNLSGASQNVNFCVEAQCLGGVTNVTGP